MSCSPTAHTVPVGFSGSYAPEDVTFLLKPITLAPTPLEEKEREIQSGRKHYSEMISFESPPSDLYLAAFHTAFSQNRARLGRDIAALAKRLALHDGPERVLVSFARAGTPVGVLLRRALVVLGCRVHHYAISIIRDRGLDEVALDLILDRHAVADLVFVDGWTGKGGIHGALVQSMAHRSKALRNVPFCVVSDLAGCATLAAGDGDYVIPSAILNGVISGLVSRTILNRACIQEGDFHGCLVWHHLAPWDLSRWFVEEQMKDVRMALEEDAVWPAQWTEAQRASAAQISRGFMREMMARVQVTDPHRIKPGIGEATRAVLRRMPDRLFVRDAEGVDLAHLVGLAQEKGVRIEVEPDLPYQACAIIRSMGRG